VPRGAVLAGRFLQFLGDVLERGGALARVVDLEELQRDLVAALVARHRFLEDLLGLRIAAIGDVDLGLGDRVDLVGVDRARTGLVEVRQERAIAGVD
jgi:hypothetical protein